MGLACGMIVVLHYLRNLSFIQLSTGRLRVIAVFIYHCFYFTTNTSFSQTLAAHYHGWHYRFAVALFTLWN
jgi:hypothetical protein